MGLDANEGEGGDGGSQLGDDGNSWWVWLSQVIWWPMINSDC